MFYMVSLNLQVFIEGDQGCREINIEKTYKLGQGNRRHRRKRRACGRKQKNQQDNV
jgi:hypothetical protein